MSDPPQPPPADVTPTPGDSPGNPDRHPPRRPGRATHRLSGVLAVVLLGAGLGLMVDRGAQRALSGAWDFTMIYGGARQVARGADPYDFEAAFDAYEAAGGEVAQQIGDPGRIRDPAWFHALYPPTAYTMLSPVGLGVSQKFGFLVESARAFGFVLKNYQQYSPTRQRPSRCGTANWRSSRPYVAHTIHVRYGININLSR